MKILNKVGQTLLAVGAVVVSSVQSAFADSAVVTAAQTAFSGAGTDATTMGGYVITAVIGVAAIGILLKVVNKV